MCLHIVHVFSYCMFRACYSSVEWFRSILAGLKAVHDKVHTYLLFSYYSMTSVDLRQTHLPDLLRSDIAAQLESQAGRQAVHTLTL